VRTKGFIGYEYQQITIEYYICVNNDWWRRILRSERIKNRISCWKFVWLFFFHLFLHFHLLVLSTQRLFIIDRIHRFNVK